jgi:solute carrier family 35, member E2
VAYLQSSVVTTRARKSAAMLAAAFWMGSWYFSSLVTLFINKILLSGLGVDVQILGLCQIGTAALIGLIKVALFTRSELAKDATYIPPHTRTGFWRSMLMLGAMRAIGVVLGLVSLSLVAVSFTETVKASAPLFTVLITYNLLGEETSLPVILSLFPVMVGLAVCAGTEQSFHIVGFLAALVNNGLDCCQNVFSKKLFQMDSSLTPDHVNFFAAAAAFILQFMLLVPARGWGVFYLFPKSSVHPDQQSLKSGSALSTDSGAHDTTSASLLLVTCLVFFYLQSVTALETMRLISPVSQSVANTLKRSLLIILSILYFENTITVMNGLGMLTVMGGVGLYSWAKNAYPSSVRTPTKQQSSRDAASGDVEMAISEHVEAFKGRAEVEKGGTPWSKSGTQANDESPMPAKFGVYRSRVHGRGNDIDFPL